MLRYLLFLKWNYNRFSFQVFIILNVRHLNDSNKELVIELYRKSFPHRERDSIHKFLYHDGSGGRIHVFYDGDNFIGFCAIIVFKNIVNLLYFAVSREFQGKGYGHSILEKIKGMYPHHVFIADIEKDEEKCVNHDMRKKRELFYIHDDFIESDIEYSYKGVDYVIMVANGTMSRKEFKDFWSHYSHVDDLGKYICTYFK